MAMTLRSIFVIAALAMEAIAIHVEKALLYCGYGYGLGYRNAAPAGTYNTVEASAGVPVFASATEGKDA